MAMHPASLTDRPSALESAGKIRKVESSGSSRGRILRTVENSQGLVAVPRREEGATWPVRLRAIALSAKHVTLRFAQLTDADELRGRFALQIPLRP